MKRRTFVGLVGLTIGAAAARAQSRWHQELIGRWEQSRDYTLAVAQKMPPEHYSYKPVPEQFSFGQQMSHIAKGIHLLIGAVRGDKRQPEGPDDLTKNEAVKQLESAFAFGLDTLKQLSAAEADQMVDSAGGRRTKRGIFQLVLDHNTHHRAQAIVYMRLKGIAPPDYRF